MSARDPLAPVPSARTALIRVAAPLALMGLIFFLSAQPNLDSGLGIWDTIGRKLVHLGIYSALTLAWAWALRPVLERPALAAAAISLLYAISDEYHQTFVAGRAGHATDVLIDLAGILLALALIRHRFGPGSILRPG